MARPECRETQTRKYGGSNYNGLNQKGHPHPYSFKNSSSPFRFLASVFLSSSLRVTRNSFSQRFHSTGSRKENTRYHNRCLSLISGYQAVHITHVRNLNRRFRLLLRCRPKSFHHPPPKSPMPTSRTYLVLHRSFAAPYRKKIGGTNRTLPPSPSTLPPRDSLAHLQRKQRKRRNESGR